MKSDLVTTLIEATGLPEESIAPEVHRLLKEHEVTDPSLEDLREIVAEYLQSVFEEILEEKSA